MKKFTIILFVVFIFIFPIITIIKKDKKVSEIENKILTQFKYPTLNSVIDKSFMKNFDNYVTDQFPFRENFISLKNNYSYLIGQREFREIYITKTNRLVEKFITNEEIIYENIKDILKISSLLKKNNINPKVMIIPTSIEFYKDELDTFLVTDNQKLVLDNINKIFTNNKLNFYTPYDILKKYKDKYIYFNTDHHWTQLGAYISYMDMFYNSVSIDKLSKNYKKVSDNFLGTYYSKVLIDKIKPDSIYSYYDFNDFNIEIDFSEKFNTLYDKSKLKGKNKYQYFLHGDPGFAIINGNKSLTNEVLIFKDSYAHNFIPFLTNNYSKIHIIDPRYYNNIDLEKYIKENKNINECIFIHNIKLFNDSKIYNNINIIK